MTEWIRKQWTSLLGALFVLIAFISLFQYTVDAGWITDNIKIGTGLLVGAGFFLAGAALLAKTAFKIPAEIIAGLGTAILFTTFSFAGVTFAIWDSMTVFICMIAVTAGITLYAFRFDLRVLMNVGLLGALASPMLLRPEDDQVFTLFLYLLVLNSAYFFLSIRKQWTELRLAAFAGTWLLYAVYFFHFNPLSDGVWSLPFRYAAAAFLYYVIAFLFSSWKSGMKFDGLDLYAGIVNAVLFGLWSIGILDGVVPYAYPLAGMGLIYILSSFAVQRLTGKIALPVMIKFLGGVLLLLLAATQFGKGWDYKPLLSVYFWLGVAFLLLLAGQAKKSNLLKSAALTVWALVGCYWFAVTWDTPWGEWFGVYIPFLNTSALAWELLAWMGFYFSVKVVFDGIPKPYGRQLATLISVFSHLIVGGLLTLQIINFMVENKLDRGYSLPLSLSISWGIYALLLFVWGAYSRQTVFRVFGSVVLLIVAAKTLLFDLSGKQTVYRILVLLVLGAISFGISYINHKWKEKDGSLRPDEPAVEDTAGGETPAPEDGREELGGSETAAKIES